MARLARNPSIKRQGRRRGFVRAQWDWMDRGFGLPNDFTADDWAYALDYWDHRCAVCGTEADGELFLAKDHWYPLSRIGCPGTLPSNIIPLCHYDSWSCNVDKSNKEPLRWVIDKLGYDEGMAKFDEIMSFFETVRQTEYDTDR